MRVAHSTDVFFWLQKHLSIAILLVYTYMSTRLENMWLTCEIGLYRKHLPIKIIVSSWLIVSC